MLSFAALFFSLVCFSNIVTYRLIMTLIYGPPNYFEIFFMEACITVNS